MKKKLSKEEKQAEAVKQLTFFIDLWLERCDDDGNCFCYETGEKLLGDYLIDNSCCYHHILPKEKYPEYKYSKENVVILEPSVHTQVHTDMDKTPKVKELTYLLKQKHKDGSIE